MTGTNSDAGFLDGLCFRQRTVKWSSANQLIFSEGVYWHQTVGSGADNYFLIPLSVYGLKK